jgi:prepilin-type N-terminal cleavage/methylation domain-containing protein
MCTKKKAVLNRHGGTERGLTMIEMVLVIVLTGIIVVTVNPYIRINVNGYVTVQQQKMGIQMARIALNRMMAEMKTMRSNGDITVSSSTGITFRMYDQSGNWDGTVRYNYTAGSFFDPIGRVNRIWNGGAPFFLAETVRSFSLTYYNLNHNSTTAMASIRSIEIQMEVGKSATEKFLLTGEVFPPNLQ